MNGLLKRFAKKKKERPRSLNNLDSRGSPLGKEVQHGFVDGVGGLSFPTSPTKKNALSAPSSRRAIEPSSSEFTIMWSRPSLHHGMKVNPIFINEPTEFYEGAFIPPDNAHDFGALPRYRVDTALYDDDVSMAMASAVGDGNSSLYRSRSLGAIPSYGIANQGMNLADVKKRRKEELATTGSRGNLFGLFDQSDEYLYGSPSAAGRRQSERDSGVYPMSDWEAEDDVQQQHLVSSGDSGIDNLPKDDDTMLEKRRVTHDSDSRLHQDNERPTSRSGSSSFGSESGKGEAMFFISQNSFSGPEVRMTEEPLRLSSSTTTTNNNDNGDDSSIITSDDFDIVQWQGSLTRPKSMPDVNKKKNKHNRNDRDKGDSEQDPTVDTMDSRSSSLLREKNLFTHKASPTLSALPRGRVSSIKCSLEGTEKKSKSVSNLSAATREIEDLDDTDDDEPFGRRSMKSAASFGHINTTSLSPLLNDRKFFQSAIVSKKNGDDYSNKNSAEHSVPLSNGERRSTFDERRAKVDILTNNDETFRVVRRSAADELEEEEREALVKHRLGVDGGQSNNERVASTPLLTIADLNAQTRSETPSHYVQSEGTFNTLTGAGVTILKTKETPVVRRKPTVESILKAMGMTELPEVIEENVSFLFYMFYILFYFLLFNFSRDFYIELDSYKIS